MIFLLTLIFIIYAIFNFWLWFGWRKIPQFSTKPILIQNSPQITLSVLIPVRNEAANILALLRDFNSQTIDYQYFEVIVINDNSDDNTAEIVQNFIPQAHYLLKLIHLSPEKSFAPKKQAIQIGIAQSQGEYIVCTDGDCRVSIDWLALILAFYQKTKAKLISSLVTFDKESNIFEQIQTVEFASLVASGAATMQIGFPTMCNGANISYSKSVFYEVNGFEGTDKIASGDDEFLMHKIAQKYPKKVFFLKNPQSIVYTQAQKDWKSFFQQRKRWGSKWQHYQDFRIKILAFFIFLVNFNLIVATGLWLGGFQSVNDYFSQLAIKFIPEWIFLGSFLVYLGKKKLLLLIPLVQIIYPFYVVLFGLMAQTKNFEWKGRKLN